MPRVIPTCALVALNKNGITEFVGAIAVGVELLVDAREHLRRNESPQQLVMTRAALVCAG